MSIGLFSCVLQAISVLYLHAAIAPEKIQSYAVPFDIVSCCPLQFISVNTRAQGRQKAVAVFVHYILDREKL